MSPSLKVEVLSLKYLHPLGGKEEIKESNATFVKPHVSNLWFACELSVRNFYFHLDEKIGNCWLLPSFFNFLVSVVVDLVGV